MASHIIDDVDDILVFLSSPNRFQVIQFIVLSGQYIPIAMNDMMPIFYGLPPAAVRCRDNISTTLGNWTAWNKGNVHAMEHLCNCSSGYEYEYPDRQWSTIADMNLICGRGSLADLATVIYFLGQMVASPFCGWFADKIGRRPALLAANVLYMAATLALVFSRDYASFVCLRFLVGFATEGMICTFFVLLIEWTPPNKRNLWAVILEMWFGLGVLLLTLMAYLLQNWVLIQCFMAAASVLALPLYWFAPESMGWMCVHNREDEVEQTCLQVASFNGITIPESLRVSIKKFVARAAEKESISENFTFLDCFRTPVIRKTTFICCMGWFSCFMGYLGLAYLSVDIAENVYLNLAINGFLEFIPILFAYGLASRFGHRIPLIVYFLFGGIFAIIAGTIPGVTYTEMISQNVMAFISRMGFVATTCVIFVYTSELFPTVIRHNCFSLCSLALRVGCVFTPLLSLMDSDAYKGAGFVVVGLAGILAASGTALLPETKGRPLPHTIDDAESLGRKVSMKIPELDNRRLSNVSARRGSTGSAIANRRLSNVTSRRGSAGFDYPL